jgi:hypothetical protein
MLYMTFGTCLTLQCSLVAGRLTSGLHSATSIVSVGAIVQAIVLFWLLLFYRSDFCKFILRLYLWHTVIYSYFPAHSPMAGVLGAAVPLFIGALWGVGDGVLNTQLSALLGLLFEDVKVNLFETRSFYVSCTHMAWVVCSDVIWPNTQVRENGKCRKLPLRNWRSGSQAP